MGLDMYLNARRYFHHYPGDGPDAAIAGKIAELLGGDRTVSHVSCEVAYWRKANAIHRWFVENCQEGKDDCREYSVSHAQLGELLAAVDKVLADRQQAPAALPTQKGFFFGGTEYDSYYFEYLQDTKEQIQPLLGPAFEGWRFYYVSSW